MCIEVVLAGRPRCPAFRVAARKFNTAHEVGTADATAPRMIGMKETNKLFKNILRALPAISAIPFLAPKKTSVLPYVLGAVGVAVVGGIAAVMIFSPRTRYRALDIAKDGYGRVRGQLDELGVGEKLGLQPQPQRTANTAPQGNANGLANDNAARAPGA
ncbi:MAG TPA: hypothetical protein VLT33_43685 [Labilithrix sp.]|nr:hypothetical protein [Labilithrix sp.]